MAEFDRLCGCIEWIELSFVEYTLCYKRTFAHGCEGLAAWFPTADIAVRAAVLLTDVVYTDPSPLSALVDMAATSEHSPVPGQCEDTPYWAF